MDAIIWVAGANALAWLGIGAYVAMLAARQGALRRRLENLERDHGGDE